jgi:hypothetical protein
MADKSIKFDQFINGIWVKIGNNTRLIPNFEARVSENIKYDNQQQHFRFKFKSKPEKKKDSF